MTYFNPVFVLAAMSMAGTIAMAPVSAAAQTTEAAPETADTKLSAAEKFATIDLDGNGLVSEAEFLTYATEAHGASPEDASAKFTQIAGDDGVISADEFEAVHSANRRAEKKPHEGRGS